MWQLETLRRKKTGGKKCNKDVGDNETQTKNVIGLGFVKEKVTRDGFGTIRRV